MTEPVAETRGFQTEARKLLKLMINSLYSNREIFLRELISNASDAIDRLRFEALADESLTAEDAELRIVVEFDKDAGTVSVIDNGIGMSLDEAAEHLGTIAKSGTEEFFERLTGDQKNDSALIGQFGVGFYSAFIVAKEVEVLTRRAGTSEGTRWVSTGEDEFSIEPAADLPRGTRVTLKLKPDATEFADGFRLRSVVRRYSDHVGVPVMMAKETYADEAKKDEKKDAEAPELETVNAAKALWTRARNDISEDEYKEFYKHISHDFEDPALWGHNKVEGKLEYTSLLYIPKRAPFDLWNRELPRGLKLYVQRVFIMDDADQFLPLYLRFVRGIVDSSDLPLNVSREILQEDERVRTIKNALTKRVLDMLAKMKDEDYAPIWDEFGQVLKEGVGEDHGNKDALLGLLRFTSTFDDSQQQRVSLTSYIERLEQQTAPAKDAEDAEERTESVEEPVDKPAAKETKDSGGDGGKAAKKKIYYLIAESETAARQSPHLEVFRKRGIEVLLLTDRIDEWWISFAGDYEGYEFQDVARGELDLDEDADKDDAKKDDEPLLKRLAEVLDGKVESVRKSTRLTDSPACLVLGEQDLGAQMRRIMELSGQQAPETKPHLEVHLGHPLIEHLDKEPDEDRFRDLALVIFDQASLAEGTAVAEPGAYVQRINKLLLDLL